MRPIVLRHRGRGGVVVPRPGRGTGQGGHGIAHELGGTGGDLGEEVALRVEDAHLAELVPDALDPLVHGRAGVAAEADGHGLEVYDEAPLVVRGDQGGAAREQQIVSIYPDILHFSQTAKPSNRHLTLRQQ